MDITLHQEYCKNNKECFVLNKAHKESLELLNIVHKICKIKNITYTITADTLIAYQNNVPFENCVPMIYIAVMYPDFLQIKTELLQYCNNNCQYSIHDYTNTKQFNTFELWFVKEADIQFPDYKKDDAFYYGTRLIVTPLFFAGDTEAEWEITYKYFRDATATMNVSAMLKKKPLKSYIKLRPRRKIVNTYIKQRGLFNIEEAIRKYAMCNPSRYIIYPHVNRVDKQNMNSIPWIVNENSKFLTYNVWSTIEEVNFYGIECYIAVEREKIIQCFPQHIISYVLNKDKSDLVLNGNTYLWRIQQIQIELLSEFDCICRKYGLRYNLGFGTLLGAVRHKGFIPWDDDIDVTMPWEDFNKLDDAMARELDHKKYYFRCPQNEENNHLIFKHLERIGTLYTKSKRTKLQHQIGVFIDIFPMYPSAPFVVLDWIHAKICHYWRTALWATIGYESEPDPKKRKYYERISKPGNTICYQNFVKAAMFFNFKNNRYLKFWIAMDRNPYKVPLVEMKNYIDPIEIEFEGKCFFAPRNYEGVLSYALGEDWKLYPPPAERLPLHNGIVDIGKLYEV